MRKVILLTSCCIVALNLYAQFSNELPYGLKEEIQLREQNVIVLTAPEDMVERIKKEDSIGGKWGAPYAFPIRVNYTLENSGVWQELDDGSKIWCLKVNLPGSFATFPLFDKFWLPEGGKFFVYSEDTRQSIGAITSRNIGGSKDEPIMFRTPDIYGENVVYEYYQPAWVKESPVISISDIYYGHRYRNNPYKNTSNLKPFNIIEQ